MRHRGSRLRFSLLIPQPRAQETPEQDAPACLRSSFGADLSRQAETCILNVHNDRVEIQYEHEGISSTCVIQRLQFQGQPGACTEVTPTPPRQQVECIHLV